MKTSYSILSRRIGNTFALILGAWTTLLHAQPGSLDTNFNATATSPPIPPPSPFSSHVGFSVAAQPDGKVIAAGTFGVLRLLSDGSIDPSFQSIPPGPAPFTGPGSGVGAVALQPDGRILVAGNFTNAAGIQLPAIVRLNADGSIDPSFNLDPRAQPAGDLALQPDGKVVSAGSYFDPVHQENGGLIRLRPDGSLDPDFDSRGISAGVFALAPGGKIYVATGTTVLRVNPDGSRDETFAAQTHPSYGASALAVQSDGKILVGSYSDGIGFFPPPLRRLLTDGTDDPGWIPTDMNGGDAVVHSILVQPDGKVLAGGNNLESFNGVFNANLGRLNPDGSVDTTFDTRGDLHYYSVEDMALGPDGKVIVAGMQLSRPDITPGPGVWRLNNDLEPRGIEFTATSYLAHEGDGWVSIPVRRTTGTNQLAIVAYAVRPGTATRWRDYFGGDGVLVFHAGETLRRIRIYVVRDHKTEGFETVRLTLVRARGGSLGPQRTATLNILDR